MFLRLLRFVRPYWPFIAIALLCAVVYSGGRISRLLLIQPVLDHVLPAVGDGPIDLGWPGLDPLIRGGQAILSRDVSSSEPGSIVWLLLIFGAVVSIVIPFAGFGRAYGVAVAMGRVVVDMQQSICAKLLVLPLASHRQRQRGDAMVRVLSDTSVAGSGLGLFFSHVAQDAIYVVSGFGALMAISWQLSSVILLVVPPIAWVAARFGSRIERTARRRQESVGDLTQRLVRILSGIKVIQAFRAEEQEQAAFGNENERLFRRSLKVVRQKLVSRGLVEGLSSVGAMVVMGFGIVVVTRSMWGVSAGELAAFVPVLVTTQRRVRDLMKGWTMYRETVPSAGRFFEMLDAPEADPEPPDAVALTDIQKGVRFRGVSFSYDRVPVLRDIHFEIGAGQFVAVVGKTGAGKTTIADLLLGFLHPDAGCIEIDGVDLRRIRRSSLLDRVAIVGQEPFLFDGSIRENILYGRPGVSEASFEQVVEAAYVSEFACSLPDGYETRVGELGGRLSGGQRQRITIARALLKDPALLVFDEATSALDAASERWVQDAVAHLFEHRTVLMIAHRFSTIRGADQILVLDEGTICERGTHDELIAAGGLYHELATLQATTDS